MAAAVRPNLLYNSSMKSALWFHPVHRCRVNEQEQERFSIYIGIWAFCSRQAIYIGLLNWRCRSGGPGSPFPRLNLKVGAQRIYSLTGKIHIFVIFDAVLSRAFLYPRRFMVQKKKVFTDDNSTVSTVIDRVFVHIKHDLLKQSSVCIELCFFMVQAPYFCKKEWYVIV